MKGGEELVSTVIKPEYIRIEVERVLRDRVQHLLIPMGELRYLNTEEDEVFYKVELEDIQLETNGDVLIRDTISKIAVVLAGVIEDNKVVDYDVTVFLIKDKRRGLTIIYCGMIYTVLDYEIN